ncbi:MAG TPA: hypothetical protein VIK72_00530 [Clostridiaceae bacterium]
MNNQLTNSGCSLPTLAILILIILQFSKNKIKGKAKPIVDNSILFIITIYFLSCCNKYTI